MSIPESVPSPDSSQEDAKSNNSASDSPTNGGSSANSDAKTGDPKSQSLTPQWSNATKGPLWPELEANDETVLAFLDCCATDGVPETDIANAVGSAVGATHALTRLTGIGFATKSMKGSMIVYTITDKGHNRLRDLGLA